MEAFVQRFSREGEQTRLCRVLIKVRVKAGAVVECCYVVKK